MPWATVSKGGLWVDASPSAWGFPQAARTMPARARGGRKQLGKRKPTPTPTPGWCRDLMVSPPPSSRSSQSDARHRALLHQLVYCFF